MKKIIIVICTFILIINVSLVNCYGGSFYNIEESLRQLGLDEEYCDNIISYIYDLRLSKEEVNDITEDAGDIMDTFYDSENISELDLSQYFKIYSKAMDIANSLNIDVNIDFNDKYVSLIDKNTDNTLFEGDITSIKQIYSNYKNLNSDNVLALADLSSIVANRDEVIEGEKLLNEFSNNINKDNYIAEADESQGEHRDNTYINESNSNNKYEGLDKYVQEIHNNNKSLMSKNENSFIEWKIMIYILGGITIFIALLKLLLSR